MKPAGRDRSPGDEGQGHDPHDASRPVQLVYLREPPGLAPPPLTRWQGVAVVVFILSFPALLALVWWLAAAR